MSSRRPLLRLRTPDSELRTPDRRLVGRRPDRLPGFSLVEVLMGFAILALSVSPILWTLIEARAQHQRIDVSITASWLARSILDQSLHRLHTGDTRFFKLDTSPTRLLSSILEDDWQRPFLALARSKTKVLPKPGAPNSLFDPTGNLKLLFEPDAAQERRFWEGFSYEIKVTFTMAHELGEAPIRIDSDGDGKGEIDMARIQVEIFFDPLDGSTPERSISRLSTFVTAADKMPGVGAMADL